MKTEMGYVNSACEELLTSSTIHKQPLQRLSPNSTFSSTKCEFKICILYVGLYVICMPLPLFSAR